MLVPAQDVVPTFQLQRPGLSYTTAHRLITDLSRRGYWSNVLAILQELTSVRLRLNIITLGAAVNVFSRAPTSTWTQALGLLRAAGAQGFERSTIVQNSVLNALHKAGAWELCLELLLRSWPPELGDSEQQPDIYSYTSTLSACGSGRQWTAALGLLQLAQRRGLILSPVAGSAAMVALEGSGQWRQALDVFDQLRSSDVQVDEPVCNSAIEVLAEGSWAFSLALLRVMPDWRLSPNLVSYIAALTACGRAQRWKSSLQLLQKASSNGLKLNEVSCGAAVSACSQGRAWQVSLGIFGEMTYRLSLEVGERGHKPLCIITYDVALGACLAGQRWEASLELLRGLLQQGVQPSTVTLTALVSNRAHQSQWARAEELLARLAVQRSALNLGNEAFTALAGAYSRGQQWQRGLELLSQMRACSVEVDDVLLCSVWEGLSGAGFWPLALQGLAGARSAGVSVSRPLLGPTFYALKQGGLWHEALRLLMELRQSRGLELDSSTYGKAMMAVDAPLDGSSRWEVPLLLLDCLRSEGLQLSQLALGAALGSTAASLHWQKASELLHHARSQGVEVGQLELQAFLQSLRQGGSWHPAVSLLRWMQTAAVEPWSG
ncbi:unnamed protein product, partial [Polarella glacialis]